MDKTIDQDTLLIKDLLGKFASRWYWFVLSAVIILSAAFIMMRSAENIYQSKASILLNNRDNNIYASEKFMKEIGLFVNQAGVDDEVGILSSYTLVKETLKELDFGISYYHEDKLKKEQTYHYAPFEVHLDSSHVQVLGAKFYVEVISEEEYEIYAEAPSAFVWNVTTDEYVREVKDFNFFQQLRFDEPYSDANMGFTISRSDYFPIERIEGSYYFQLNSLTKLADSYQANLFVGATTKKSRLLELYQEGKVVAMQNRFLNKLLEVYIRQDLEKQQAIGKRTLDLIDEQLYEITDSLRRAEYSLKNFRENSNIVNIAATSDDLTRQITQLRNQQAQLNVQGQYYNYVLKDIQNRPGLTDVVAPASMGITDPLLSNLLLQLSSYNQERASKKVSLKEGNPQLEFIDVKIKDIRERILENVSSSVNANDMALEDINHRIDSLENKLGLLPERERRLTNIERQFGQSENMYKYLLQKRAEAAIALSTNTVNKYVVDEAKQVGNGPIAPQKSMTYVLALLLSLGLPAGLIVVVDFFNEKIDGEDDIAASTQIPILGYVAKHEKKHYYVIEKDARTPFAESFRALRIKMLFMVGGDSKQVIGITSSSSGEGKTFCATNLAATLAHAGKKTLLIDTDLRRPKVEAYFQLEHGKGLADYLSGEADYVNEIIHGTHIEHLHVIPAGRATQNPSDLISNQRLEDLMATCLDEYDHILFDTPPLGLVTDYLILMHHTNYNIYVVRHRVTKTEDLRLINELYEGGKIQEIGLLLNGVDAMSDYGYLDTDYGVNGYGKKKKNLLKLVRT